CWLLAVSLRRLGVDRFARCRVSTLPENEVCPLGRSLTAQRNLFQLEPPWRPAVLELGQPLLPVGVGECVGRAARRLTSLATHDLVGLACTLLRLLPDQQQNRR